MRAGTHSARRRSAGALAALAVLTVCLLAFASLASASFRLRPAAQPARGEATEVAGYWTAARMRAAQPLDAPAGAALLAGASFAPVIDPTIPPNAVNGRLFVKQGRGKGFCSATAIDSPTRRLVLTAAHCLNSGPRSRRGNSVWSRYVEFVPAFSSGVAPFGAFVGRRNSIFAPRQWVKTGNPNFDVGAVLTAPNAEGANVADAVGGGVTIALDRSRLQEFHTFGYPGKSRVLQGCDSPYVGDDATTYRIPGPPTLAIRCHWAPGASGGGWLIEDGTAIDGLTSYGKPKDRIHTFSPYFSHSNVGRLVAGM
jgi:V8-like Glu-specific endopeptidase